MAAMGTAADEAADMVLRATLYRALRGASLVFPMLDSRTQDGHVSFSLRTGVEPDGRATIFAYTSFDLAPADIRRAAVPLVEICKRISTMELSVHINAGTPGGGIVPASWVRAIAEGKPEMPRPVATLEQRLKVVEMTPASDATPELRRRLADGLVAHVFIAAAYFVWATFKDGAGFLVSVICDPTSEIPAGQRERLATELYAWVAPAMADDEDIYFEVDPDAKFLARLKAVGPPFYRRGS